MIKLLLSSYLLFLTLGCLETYLHTQIQAEAHTHYSDPWERGNSRHGGATVTPLPEVPGDISIYAGHTLCVVCHCHD